MAGGVPTGLCAPKTAGDPGSGCQGHAQGDARPPDLSAPGLRNTPSGSLPLPTAGAGSDVPPKPPGVTRVAPPSAGMGLPTYLCKAGGVGVGGLPPHCCLQVESLRILLLAEQALREGLEEALARRSALDLVLSCPDSVPFMQTALGSPLARLCPFCPASSSGTCPARQRRR